MTFYEAAVEVLREAGRPLHFKKIAEVSVARNLLSHVGKTPDATMGARLQQEARKPADETLIVQVRPGVFGLKEGVDLTEARETISLHVAPEPEPEPVVAAPAAPVRAADETPSETPVDAGAEDGDDDGDDDEADGDESGPETTAEGGSNSRRRRRRGRRGGRNRARTEAVAVVEGSEDAAAAAESAGAAPTEAAAQPNPPAARTEAPRPPREQREPREAREAREPREARDADPAPDAERRLLDIPNLHHLADVPRALVEILRNARENAETLRTLARELQRQNVGALGRIGTAVVRGEIERANLRQSQLGRPPLFEEVRPDTWALAAASGNELARSYSQLDRWQEGHRAAVKKALLSKLSRLDGASLASIVTLLLDRMGYRELRRHDPIGDELLTIAGVEPRALTSVRIAVRLLPPQKRLSRDQVIALRGSLHAYEASEAALIAVGGVDEAATREARVANLAPITIIDADTLVEHMITNGVGVRTFTVDVSCVDEPLFRDIFPEQG